MGSVQERCQSSTPKLRKKRRGSSNVITDTEAGKTSPAACLTNNSVEHFTSQITSPRTSAAGQLSIPSAHGIASEVEFSHNERDNISERASESAQCSDTTNDKFSVTDADAEMPRTGRKKKKRRSPVSSDSSKDVGLAAAREGRKHKHKNRSHETSNKDDAREAEHVASKTTNKDSVDDMVHSNHKAKHKDGIDDVSRSDKKAKHKESVDDMSHSDHRSKHKDSVDDMSHSDHKSKHKDSLDDMLHLDQKSKHKDSVDDMLHSDHKSKHKDSVGDTSHSDYKAKQKDSVDADMLHSDPKAKHKDSVDVVSHSDHKTKRKKNADDTKQKRIVDDIVNNESTNNKGNKKSKTDEVSAFKSLDVSTAKTGDSSRKVVRQYRHQDGIRERACNKTTTSHKKREKPASVSSHFYSMLTALNLLLCTGCLQFLEIRHSKCPPFAATPAPRASLQG